MRRAPFLLASMLAAACTPERPEPPDAPVLDAPSLDARDDGGEERDVTELDAGTEGPCASATGLREPLRACTEADPCVRPASDVTEPMITEPSPMPRCAHPSLVMESFEVGGLMRHACVARPSDASAAEPRPLILYFHPGGADGADTLALSTQLLARIDDHDWGSGPPGFFVAAIHGRNLHYPTIADRDGRHHDFLFRDLGHPSLNPDVAAIDALVLSLLDEGVDPDRIYVMGWSNGGFFGQMMAIARHAPTTAGYRIAAASVFATADPFAGVERDPRNDAALPGPACGLATVPSSDVPIQLVYRSCDLAVPCGASQFGCFDAEPGYDTTAWLARASGVLSIEPLLIGGYDTGVAGVNRDATACLDLTGSCPPPRTTMCTTTSRDIDCLCYFNHLIWPDGIADVGGAVTGPDRERDMLAFLGAHPLP
jgi:hypothetical protein